MNPAARVWLDTTANVRLHGETHERPTERFQAEQAHLKPLPPQPYDIGSIRSVRASKQFRVTLDTNRYSVPAEYASARVTLKAYPDRLCIYDREKLIARHLRSYERHQDIEDPAHPRTLLEQRRNAREQKLLMRFLTFSPRAQEYYQELQQRRFNPGHHLRKIVALSDIYGVAAVARAMEDAFTFQAFSCEYIANLLESCARRLPEPSALHLTRRQDLLEIEVNPISPSMKGYHHDRPSCNRQHADPPPTHVFGLPPPPLCPGASRDACQGSRRTRMASCAVS